MYAEAKRVVKKQGYTSVSELFRASLRSTLYPKLTDNGFTSEFEDEILRRASDSNEEFIEWDGKTPFSDFVLTHPPRKYQKGRNGQN